MMNFSPAPHRFTLMLISVACLTTVGLGQDPKPQQRDLNPEEKEIARLTEQKESLEEMVRQEPDGKKRHRMTEAIQKSDELIELIQQTQRVRNNKKKQELIQTAEETRTELDGLMSEISEAGRKKLPPPPMPTPTPVPEVYETENGFKIRLRMPE